MPSLKHCELPGRPRVQGRDHIAQQLYQNRTSISDRRAGSTWWWELLISIGWVFDRRPISIECIARELGISVITDDNILTDAEIRTSAEAVVIAVGSRQVRLVDGQPMLSRRGRFSLAHEIGHYLVRSITACILNSLVCFLRFIAHLISFHNTS